MQGTGVDVFDLDRHYVHAAAEGQDILPVAEVALREVGGVAGGGEGVVLIQHVNGQVPVGRRLAEHLTELATAEDS